MPRDYAYWGCGRGFAPLSAMIVHLENGGCFSPCTPWASWNIQHVNAIAEECTGFSRNVIRDLIPWFRAGGPRKYAYIGDYVLARGWICCICEAAFDYNVALTTHLQTSHLQTSHSKQYPDVIRCSECRQKFMKISGLLQHIETPKCSARYESTSVAALMRELQKEVTRWEVGLEI